MIYIHVDYICRNILLSPAQVEALQKPSKPDPKSKEMLELVKTLKSSHAAAFAEFQAASSEPTGSPENASP